MHFIVDADLPRKTVDVVRRFGYEATDVRESDLGNAPDAQIASHARERGLAIMTGDFGFADIRNYPPEDYQGIAVLQFPNTWTAAEILRLIEEFVSQREIVDRLTGRLAIVEPGRIRLRPALVR